MTPPVRRVVAPLALLAGGVAVLLAGLVLLAACRRSASSRPVEVEGSQPRSAVLRVCADPNNRPFSDARGEGFQNWLAAMLARDRGETLAYDGHAQRRGFVRDTLNAGRCDLIMGVPASDERVKRGNPALLAELNDWIERRQPEIDRLLDGYGVPRAPRGRSR